MSLASALNTAQRSLSNASTRTEVVSRNVANAENPDYARRSSHLATDTLAGAGIASIQRTTNDVLYKQSITTIADEAGQRLLRALINSKIYLAPMIMNCLLQFLSVKCAII